MSHGCVDWSTRPPSRKAPVLVLTHGDEHVYTVVPDELQTLEAIARAEFALGHDADLSFFSACVNLCHGQPARITARAWPQLSPYIGCATIHVAGPSMAENRARGASVGRTDLPRAISPEDIGVLRPPEHAGDAPCASTTEIVHDAASGHPRTSSPLEEDHRQEEGVSVTTPQQSRGRRRAMVEDERYDEGTDTDEHPAAAASPPSSPPKPTQPAVKKQRLNEPAQESGHDARSQYQPAEHDTWTQTRPRTESGETEKLMIRVAHRPSQQESKFTAKGTTRVGKVMAGACRSFGLDASRATLYLIVSVEDDDGTVENLFPCDKNDTIARAGAEHDAESCFLLKIAGDP